VLPFWNITFTFKNPYSLAFSIEFGDQIRHRRLSLGLFQKEVAQLIRISEDCITFWETKKSKPLIHQFPGIIKFLGFSPFKKVGESLSVRFQNYRIEHGFSLKKMGRKLGVDASTIRSWEREMFLPSRESLKKLKKLLEYQIVNGA
jgi:DNA-binding XRE family transcriptional regulator